MANPSFFFAIFKRLQVCEPAIASLVSSPGGAGHFSSDRTGSMGGLSGGFALFHPGDPNGIFGTILASQAWTTQLANQRPLTPQNYTKGENPLYAMLNTCTRASARYFDISSLHR